MLPRIGRHAYRPWGCIRLFAKSLYRPPMKPHVSPVPTLSTNDTTQIDDIRIKAVRPLITPALLEEWLPTPEAAQNLVEQSRKAISQVLHGADDRLLAIVGPC